MNKIKIQGDVKAWKGLVWKTDDEDCKKQTEWTFALYVNLTVADALKIEEASGKG